MTWGMDKQGNTILTLSLLERAVLNKGGVVKKVTASAQGEFTLTVKLTRKRVNRFV